MTYGTCNLGTKILPLKPELYSNSQPHRSNPNPLWKKPFNLFQKNSIPLDLLPKLTFKSFHQILLKANTNRLTTTKTYSAHTWSRLILLKSRPSLFSNFEKEVAFRTTYKGYAWGCFFFKHNFRPRNPNNFLCKFCFSSLDDSHHLFYKCPPTKQLISPLKPLLFETFRKPIILPEHTLLYNFTNKTGIPHIIIAKLASLIWLSIFQLRINNYLFPILISSSLLKE